MPKVLRIAAEVALAGFVTVAAAAQTYHPPDAQASNLAHDIFQQLIQINTTDSVGSVTAASEAMRQRLLAAGFPASDLYLGGPNDRKQNLVVRYHGTGKQPPILFICHEDVVEARREDWSMDPFTFTEKDGFYYGRGTQDMKANDAILVANFIRLRQQGYVPDRDLILALTADEESGKSNGVDWLLKNKPELLKAAFVINPDGGGVDLDHGRAVAVTLDATEKLYADYRLLTTNPGGHSSLPVPDNAIYHIADALVKLQNYKFPFELNEVTRAYFSKLSTLESGATAEEMKQVVATPPDPQAIAALSQNPEWNSMMHTTCVATRLLAGHANNALPDMAQANVNCRILPGHSREQVRQDLVHLFDDPKVEVSYVTDAGGVYAVAPTNVQFAPPPLNPQVMRALDRLAKEYWPGAPVIPQMATGASDSVYTMAAGMPSYGISGLAIETNDIRAHGRDERLPVASFYKGLEFYYDFLKMVSGGE